MADKQKALSNNGLLYFWQLIKEIFATKTEVSDKVDKVSGKGLSTNDFTTTEKNKLAGIAENANNYTLPTASATVLGGAKIGSGLTMTGDVLSADAQEGTKNYNELTESTLPKIGSVILKGTKTLAELGIAGAIHSHAIADVTGLQGKIDDITNIANGKCKAYVYDTVEDLDTDLADTTFTAGLKVGDVFLIIATDVPDYWWTGSAKAPLETTKVDLEFMTNAEIKDIVDNH